MLTVEALEAVFHHIHTEPEATLQKVVRSVARRREMDMRVPETRAALKELYRIRNMGFSVQKASHYAVHGGGEDLVPGPVEEGRLARGISQPLGSYLLPSEEKRNGRQGKGMVGEVNHPLSNHWNEHLRFHSNPFNALALSFFLNPEP